MPDPLPMVKAMGAAAIVAAVLMLLCGFPWRAPNPVRVRLGGVLGVGLGFFVGCWLLGQQPHWPTVQVRDRILLVLLPAVILVELVALLPSYLAWLVWPLRLIVVAGAMPVLLQDSVYLKEGSGPESWTVQQTWVNFACWGGALAVVWGLLGLLARRTQGHAVSLAVALACFGAGLTMMLSGYATGGPMGFALGAALVGAVIASLLLSGPADPVGVLAIGVVGLFALLVSGHFFSELLLLNAALLFFGPLLCWLPELPPRLRGVGRILLAAVPIALAVLLAQQKFAATMDQITPGTDDPSSRDYSKEYGK
jgi:hypothetical protein